MPSDPSFERGEPERARRCHEAAIAQRPNDAILLGNHAAFLADLLRDDDRAEKGTKE